MATCCHCVSPCWAWQKHWTHCPMRWCTWYCGARKPAGSSFFLKGCLLKTEVQLEIRMPNGKLGSPEISSKAMSAGSGQKHWAQWTRVPVTEEGVQMRNSTTALSCQGLVSSWNPELSSAPFVLSELAGGWHIAAWSLAGSCCPMLPGHQERWYQEESLTPALWHDLICSRKWPQVYCSPLRPKARLSLSYYFCPPGMPQWLSSWGQVGAQTSFICAVPGRVAQTEALQWG